MTPVSRLISARLADGSSPAASWTGVKRPAKASIGIGLSGLSVFRYPGNQELMVVTFEQDYRSDTLSNVMRKRQYWIKENGTWRILHEGAA